MAAIGSIEDLPDSFEGRLALLESILQVGIENVLKEAKRRDCIKYPYGRSIQPTPLITEEEFYKSGAWNEDIGVNDEPEFSYSFGFNPLEFLSNFIEWAHPNSAVARKNAKISALDRLRSVGKHALHCLDVAKEIQHDLALLKSGILWGPNVGVSDSTTVNLVCQPLRSGVVQIEISQDCSFDPVLQCYEFPYTASWEESAVYPQEFTPLKVKLINLEAGKYYFIRCCLCDAVDDSEEALMTCRFPGKAAEFFQTCSFWTLPSQEIVQQEQDLEQNDSGINFSFVVYPSVSLVAVDAMNCASNPQSSLIASDDSDIFMSPTVTCLLGDMFGAENEDKDESFYRHAAVDLFKRNPTFSKELLRSTSFGFAWNDTRRGSDVDVRTEEITHKQYLYEMKKYDKQVQKNKKASRAGNITAAPIPPVLERPPMSVSVRSALESLPTEIQEDVTRNFYRSVMLGPDIQVFFCDTRNGYMGKPQAKWLRNSIVESGALWKVVMYGLPLGVKVVGRQNNSNECPFMLAPIGSFNSAGESVNSDNPNESETNEESKDGKSSKGHVKVAKEADKEDGDEAGRPKTSIHYVLASIQRRAESKNEGNDNDSVGERLDNAEIASVDETSSVDHSKPSKSGDHGNEDDMSNNNNSIAEEDEEEEDKNNFQIESLDEESASARTRSEIGLGSGIVVVSGGGLFPYVATYDPRYWASPYFAEIQVGNKLGLAGESGKDMNVYIHEELSYMMPTYLYQGDFQSTVAGPDQAPTTGRQSLGMSSMGDGEWPSVDGSVVQCRLNLCPDGRLGVELCDQRDRILYEVNFKTTTPS